MPYIGSDHNDYSGKCAKPTMPAAATELERGAWLTDDWGEWEKCRPPPAHASHLAKGMTP